MDNIIQFQRKGRQHKIGFPIEGVKSGAFWASRAEEMGNSLLDYKGYNLEVVNTEETEVVDNIEVAVFEFFAKYNTVYILAYQGVPITTMLLHPKKEGET